MQEDETQLSGRNSSNSSSVARVGETVRRATGPWSVNVHALLLYLNEQVGLGSFFTFFAVFSEDTFAVPQTLAS